MADRDREELARRVAELQHVEQQLRALTERAEYLRMMVRAYQGLLELEEGRVPERVVRVPPPGQKRFLLRPGDTPRNARDGRPREKMFAKEAVRRVLEETQRAWQVTPLTHEIRRRGWEINSTNPVAAVRTATIRLFKTGEIIRLEDGSYAMPSVAELVARGGDAD